MNARAVSQFPLRTVTYRGHLSFGLTMAAVYFGSSDADKACDALVSDLLKAGNYLLPFEWQVAACVRSLRQSARSAGRGGSG